MAYTSSIVDIFGRTITADMDNFQHFADNHTQITVETTGLVYVNNGNTSTDDTDGAHPNATDNTTTELQANNVFNSTEYTDEIVIIAADRIFELGSEASTIGTIKNISGEDNSSQAFTAHMYFINCTFLIKNGGGTVLGIPETYAREVMDSSDDPTFNLYNCRIVNDYHFGPNDAITGAGGQSFGFGGDIMDLQYSLSNPAGRRTDIRISAGSRLRDCNFDGAAAEEAVFGGFRGYVIRPEGQLAEFDNIQSTSYGMSLLSNDATQIFGPGFRIDKPVRNTNNTIDVPTARSQASLVRLLGQGGYMFTAPYNDFTTRFAIINTSGSTNGDIVLAAHWEPTAYDSGLLTSPKEGLRAFVSTNASFTTAGEVNSISRSTTDNTFQYVTNADGLFVGNADFGGRIADGSNIVFNDFAIPVIEISPASTTSSANAGQQFFAATLTNETEYTTTVRVSDLFGTFAREEVFNIANSYVENDGTDLSTPALPLQIENIISIDDDNMVKYQGADYASRVASFVNNFDLARTISFVDLYALFKRMYELNVSPHTDVVDPIADVIDRRFDASSRTYNKFSFELSVAGGTPFDNRFVELPNNVIGIVAGGFELHPDEEDFIANADVLAYYDANSMIAGIDDTWTINPSTNILTVRLNPTNAEVRASNNFIIGDHYAIGDAAALPRVRMILRDIRPWGTAGNSELEFEVTLGAHELVSAAEIFDPIGRTYSGRPEEELFDFWFRLPVDYVHGDDLITHITLDEMDFRYYKFGAGLTMVATDFSRVGDVEGTLEQTENSALVIRGGVTGTVTTPGGIQLEDPDATATENASSVISGLSGASIECTNLTIADGLTIENSFIDCNQIVLLDLNQMTDGNTFGGTTIVSFGDNLTLLETYTIADLFGTNFDPGDVVSIRSNVPVTVLVPNGMLAHYNNNGSNAAITFQEEAANIELFDITPVIPSTTASGYIALRNLTTNTTITTREITNGALVGANIQLRNDVTDDVRVYYRLNKDGDQVYRLRTLDLTTPLTAGVTVEPTEVNPFFTSSIAEQTGADGTNPVGAAGAVNSTNDARFEITWSNTSSTNPATGPGTQYAVIEAIDIRAYFDWLVDNEYANDPVAFIPGGVIWNEDATTDPAVADADGIFNISVNNTTINYISNSSLGFKSDPTTIAGLDQVVSNDQQEASLNTVITAVQHVLQDDGVTNTAFDTAVSELKENQVFVARLNPNIPNS